jgi:drug/metabolite transporter (DMT)-like permease
MLAAELLAATSDIHFEPSQLIGIPFALVGAVFMSVGAQLQHSGVGKVGRLSAVDGEAPSALNLKQLFSLLSRPSWLFGTVMLGLAVVFQLVSLGYSPIIVVQPIGAVALVLTAIINSRVSKVKLNRASIVAIVMCVGGVGVFVTVAAFTAINAPVLPEDLIQILIILGVIMIILAVVYVFLRKRPNALFYILGAGILYGFVATFAKVVEARLLSKHMDPLLWVCLAALLLAAVIGGLFVQNAYSSGPPDLVIAGLTVIDPLVAVCIGIAILDEASQAPPWAVVIYVLAGAVAIAGVFLMSRVHPQSTGETGEVPRLVDTPVK